MTYDEAVTALYQAPVETFVAERKRLAGELKAAGDKTGATKLGKLGRPTLSAWVVNQLWWHAREAFDALFTTAGRIRGGELAAQAAHRDAIADLRGRAARMLTDAGHNANEAVLRRVTTTLSALAAAGGFGTDAPGALAEDRETAGFDVAMALAEVPVRPAPTPRPPPPPPPPPKPPEPEVDEEEEAERRAEAQRALDAENKKKEAESKKKEEADAKKREEQKEKDARAAKAAERSKLIANLATAQSELARRKRVVDQLSEQLEAAENQVAEAESIVAGLQSMLENHA